MTRFKPLSALFSICLLLSIFVFDTDAQTKRRRPAKRPGATKPVVKNTSAGVTTPSGLTFLITKKGTGRIPKAGETVVLNYTGTLLNGAKFDSSHDRNSPFAFKLGAGQVIKGWDEGVAKLRVGDQAIFVIPSELGYGARGAGQDIPPNATLIFVVELLDVKAKSMTDVLGKVLAEKGFDAMIAEFHNMKKAGDPDIYVSESDLNGFGYRLLNRKMLPEAIEVFKLNVEAFPQSANAFDSLGEAYMLNNNKEKAIENYQKALQLDPGMESAKQALKRLTGQ